MVESSGIEAAMSALASDGQIGKPVQRALFNQDESDQPIETRRGAGRPVGSRNRRTQEVIDLLVARHGDPLLNLAALVALDDIELIKRGVDSGDVVKFKRDGLIAMLPYLHARRVETKLETDGQFTLILGDINHPDADRDAKIVEVKENNDLTDDAAARLENRDLESVAKPNKNQPVGAHESGD